MNELDLIKLNIFEAYDNGEISYGEKEYLLEQVDYMYEDAYSRKMNRLDKEIYHLGREREVLPLIDRDAYVNNELKTTRLMKTRDRLGWQMRYRGLDDRYAVKQLSGKGHSHVDSPHNMARDFTYFKGDSPILPKHKENYDSFVANRKKLQQTNDKLANKAPGSILAIQNAKKQQADVEKQKAEKAAVKKSVQRRLEASKRKPIDNRLTKESTFDLLLESINDLYYED